MVKAVMVAADDVPPVPVDDPARAFFGEEGVTKTLRIASASP